MVDVHVLADTGRVDIEDLIDIHKYPVRKGLGRRIRVIDSYIIRPDSINVRKTVTYTGLNKHSGKRWFKYDVPVNYSFKVRELKNGKKYLYIWNVPTKKGGRPHEVFPSEAFNTLYGSKYYIFWQVVLQFCEDNIGSTPPYIPTPNTLSGHFSEELHTVLNFYCKPNLLFFVGGANRESSSLFRRKNLSLRTSSFHEIFKKLLGHMYSKKLANLVAYDNTISFVHRLSKLPKSVPVDWVIDRIETGVISGYHLPNEEISELFDEYVPKGKTREMFEHLLSLDYNVREVFTDSLRMIKYLGINPENFPDYNKLFKLGVEDLHDKLTDMLRVRKIEDYTEPLNLPVLPEALQALGFTLPQTKRDLYNWSSDFNNCVSSYTELVSTGATLVLRRGDEACIEIRGGILKQYLGKYNQNLEPEKFWEGVDILLEHGMIKEQPNKDNCWGFVPQEQKELVTQ